MKKTLRKLNLSRETLRTLDDSGLDAAAGGATKNNCPQTGSICEYTWGCTGPALCTTA